MHLNDHTELYLLKKFAENIFKMLIEYKHLDIRLRALQK